MNEFSFERLTVYQKARQLVVSVYQLLGEFPNTEKFALCDQIRRAIISVPSNIAEQCGRTSLKEKIHFIEIAYGSLMEAYCQLQVSVDLNYISFEQFNSVRDAFFDVSRLLNGLSKSYQEKV